MLNYFLDLEKVKRTPIGVFESMKSGDYDNIDYIHSKSYDLLESLAAKMKERFKKGFFTDEDDKKCKIDAFTSRADKLDENIQKLLEMFSKELFDIYNEIPCLT